MGSPAIDLSAGFVPKPAAAIDLSAGFVPKPQSLTDNPGGEGTYSMASRQGSAKIPYSNVATAQKQGYMFQTNDDLQRYNKDRGVDPNVPQQKGFLESAWDSGPVAGLLHGAEAVGGLLSDAVHGRPASDDNPITQAVHKSPTVQLLSDAVHGRPANDNNPIVQGVQGLVKHGPTLEVRRKLANSIPMIGDALATAEQQSDAGNNSGAMGTMVGLGANALAPEAVKGVVSKIGPAAGRALLFGKTPEAAYEEALKPSTTLSPQERAAAVQTGLEHGIPVTKAGVDQLSDLIDDYNQKIADVIATDPRRPIDPQAVATRVDQIAPRMASQVNASEDLAMLESAKQQFLKEQGATDAKPGTPPQPTGLLDAQGNPIMSRGTPGTPAKPAPPMNAADAQAMKQGTYRSLGGKSYGELKAASVEGQKALARGLKDELARQFPELNQLNATDSRLLDLQPILEKAVNRAANHQAIGIGTPIVGAAAKAITGSGAAGIVGGMIKTLMDNPMIKTRLAIAVSKGAKIPYATAAARVRAYQAALGSASLGSQAYSSDDSPIPPTPQQP